MGTGSDHGNFVLLKVNQGHTSQAYSLEKKPSPNSNTTSTKHSCALNLFLLKCCVFRSPCADAAINGLKKTISILPVHSLPQPDIPSHMVMCPLKPGCFVVYCQ